MDEVVGHALHGLTQRIHARAALTASAILVVTLVLGVYTALNLGVNSNNLELIAADLPSRVNHAAFSEHFPNLENALLVVVDGDTPELAREGAEKLEAGLLARKDRFEDVYLPGGGSFFEENGLLYRSVDELDVFADRLAAIQPIVAELERDASIANLTRLVEVGLDSVRSGDGNPDDWPDVLERVGDATVSVYAEFPVAISWEEVLLRGSALDMTTRRIVIVHPVLEFGSVFAAGDAMAAIREVAAENNLIAERGVVVRITGNPALNYEEMAGILWDIFVSGVFCFAMVVVILWFALRSWHLAVAAVATLLVGLVWTAAFATVAVGYLNLVSLAAAILFIGLGVDFAIHLGTRYADFLRDGQSNLGAMIAACEDVGGSLVLCTVTTAIGFLVFVPTDYRGVAQLGLISGVGMVLILLLTLTLFPALLFSWLRFDAERHLRHGVTFRYQWWRWFDAHPRIVRGTAALLGLGAVSLIPLANFDPNVIAMRDPTTESVQAFNDLLAQAGSASPWYVDSMAPSLQAADELAARFEELDSVSHTITLDSYVPADQEDKLDVLEDIRFLLEPPPRGVESLETPSVADQVAALRKLNDFLDTDWVATDSSSLGASMRSLRAHLATFIERLDADDDPAEALERLDTILLVGLPDQLARLRSALDPSEIELASLPPDLARRMLAKDGTARVQIFPAENLQEESEMRRFTDAVLSVEPSSSGIAINLIALEDATKRSFQQALLSALLLIALLLWLLWNRLSDMLLVLAPLFLSTAITVALMGVFDVAFNFVNVIVIPLMFGVGVDSGIHLVHRSHSKAADEDGLLGTTTARAVYYSALTTIVSFGSLAFSSHLGMASLGILLTIGMILTVFCNLIVLPSLIALRKRSASAK